MKSKIYIPFFLSSFLLLLSVQPAWTCGYYETEADYQAMMFRAMLPEMKSLRPFNYTMNSIYYQRDCDTDIDKNDRYRNCAEWLAVCDQSVSVNDIYKIQYDTNGKLFEKAYTKNRWEEDFPGNTFIEFLIRKENKDLLEYMLFAKKMELFEVGSSSYFEEWENPGYYYSGSGYYRENPGYDKNWQEKSGNTKRKLLTIAWDRLNTAPTVFLQQRYAFQVCRLQYQLGETLQMETADVYDKYFGEVNPNNLMSIWAGLFKAMSMLSSNEHYRYLIQVFMNSDEKKMRCIQLFDDQYDPDPFTPEEQSAAIVMIALRNPGRALDQINKAYTLDRNNKYLPFLALREINKLEDWLITPLFYGKYSITNSDPFRCAYYDPWIEEYYEEDETARRFRDENLVSDRQYLAQLKLQLVKMLSNSIGETKDFYAIGLAHLSLLQENASDARKYLSMISSGTNPTIKLQKDLETIWLAIKTQDIHSEAFKRLFVKHIAGLERVLSPNYENNQMLYTLTLSLANEYLKKGNRIYGNLIRLKSNIYENAGNYDNWHSESYRSMYDYPSIEYFDKNATISDMDNLIALLEKKEKTPFEKYLLDQPLSSVNAYKELKGTIAFRNNDLQLAYTTFASMPQDYWSSYHFSFSSYLNEDPFIPKGLRAEKFRKFDYQFNKADFVKELIDLQARAADNKTKCVDCYLRLGDAYFNTSYWGNSWMMTRYSSSTRDTDYTKIECLPAWMRDYMTAGIARKYYKKALNNADNDEQRAYASVMLHHIHRLCYAFRREDSDKDLALMFGDSFMQYNKTKTFRMYECPGIAYFLNSR